MTNSAVPRRSIAFVIVVCGFLIAYLAAPLGLPSRVNVPELNPSTLASSLEYRIASDGKTAMVHAPTLVELADGRLLAAWFGGSREGGRDVKIDGAYYDPESGLWSESFTLMTTTKTAEATRRFIKKLGNPVLTVGPDNQLWLIYVSVSVGGWATSQLNLAISDDLGLSWGPPKRLVTSPFLNLSTLVKGVPFTYQDGSLGIPAYHELAGKFGEIVRINQNGDVVDKVRLDKGKDSLQPVVLINDQKSIDVYLRYAGDIPPYRVLKVSSNGGGDNWSEPVKTTIANPNSAIAAFNAVGRSWIIGNDTEDERNRLALLVDNGNGSDWRVAHYFEDRSSYESNPPTPKVFTSLAQEMLTAALVHQPERKRMQMDRLLEVARTEVCEGQKCFFQYDYPYVITARDGHVHLLFTWNRSAVKHIQFTNGWLQELVQ